MPRKTVVAALAGVVLLAAAPATFAGDRDGDDGSGAPDRGCACDCGCRHSEDVRLPASFFYDSGGVGPAFFDFGPTGGGGEEFAFTASRVSANASASARAAAQARAFVSVHVSAHGGMMHMHGGKHY